MFFQFLFLTQIYQRKPNVLVFDAHDYDDNDGKRYGRSERGKTMEIFFCFCIFTDDAV